MEEGVATTSDFKCIDHLSGRVKFHAAECRNQTRVVDLLEQFINDIYF